MVKKNIFKYLWVGYIVITIVGSIGVGIISLLFDDQTEKITLADGFTISAYNMVLDVSEDNKVNVTENITVDWKESNHHGIYKITPEWLKYTDKNGDTIKRKSIVSNYRAIGEEYSLDTVNKKKKIKIGSANKYVSPGEKTYTIKYTYDMGEDPFKNFDEFIFHAYGDYWGTEIKKPTIEINMPKSIDGNKINFFLDKERKSEVNKYVTYTINGNTITAKFDSEQYKTDEAIEYCKSHTCKTSSTADDYAKKNYTYIKSIDRYIPESESIGLTKSLTVDIELPDNYFVGGSWNYGFGSLIISIIIIILTIITIVTWRKFGKDNKKEVSKIEFYPPENLSAAEIGYIYGNKSNKKLTISLLVQLASKGYIKIDEIKDKDNKKQIQITNLIKVPKKIGELDESIPKRTIEIEKLMDIDDKLSLPEKTMMSYLFKKNNYKVLDTNINKFLEVKDSLIKNGYIKIVKDSFEDIDSILQQRKLQYEEKVAQYNLDMKQYMDTLSKKQPLSELEKIVYDRLKSGGDVFVLSEHKTFYKTFDDVNSEITMNLKDKIEDKKATSKIVGAIIRNILIFILCIVSYIFVEDLDPKWGILYKISFICIIINLIFTLIMKRKTEYGEHITAKVKGFRDFLVTADKNKLKELFSQNPNYFYDILPYTYALGISKKWIRLFDKNEIPEVDMGNFDYSSDWSYYLIFDNVYYPRPVHSSSRRSSSSIGSSSGGGCSSCGGGGSW